jgi:DNA-directed RNA polymerase subunit RPC12/RpoP
MIRFKCIYCGQKVRTSDGNGGKKGKCPKCKSMILIPAGQTAAVVGGSQSETISIENSPIGLGNIEFCEDIEEEYEKRWFNFLIPTYDELSVFLISISLILITISNSEMRAFLWGYILDDWRNIILLLMIVFALYVCLCQPFITRRKNIGEKYLMLFVAVFVNGGTGIIAGGYILDNSADWLAIFPLWNVINSLILLIMFRFAIIDERSISDRDTNAVEIIFGLMVIIAIIITCNFIYKLYWAVTLSLCVVYATSLSKAFRTAFPGRQRIVISQPPESKISQ